MHDRDEMPLALVLQHAAIASGTCISSQALRTFDGRLQSKVSVKYDVKSHDQYIHIISAGDFLCKGLARETRLTISNKLLELHNEEWLRKQVCYLSDCQRHSRGLQALHLPIPVYKEASPFPSFPTAQWFLAVYI